MAVAVECFVWDQPCVVCLDRFLNWFRKGKACFAIHDWKTIIIPAFARNRFYPILLSVLKLHCIYAHHHLPAALLVWNIL